MAQNEHYQIGETCTWRGYSGRSYRFNVYDVDAPTLELDGVYVLAAPGDLFAAYQPLYIGAAENFADHLPLCLARGAALALGATTLHVFYAMSSTLDRHSIQQDLVDRYRPTLNKVRAGFAPEPGEPKGEVILFPVREQRRRA